MPSSVWRAAAFLVLAACGPDVTAAPSARSGEECASPFCSASVTVGAPALDTTLQVIHVVTPDGSGEVNHPDVVVAPQGWGRHRLYLALTPYPKGVDRHENPSVYAGNDGVSWTVEPGAKNPVQTPEKGHLSDPALVFDTEARELWLYYRQVFDSNRVYLTRSAEGTRWSAPVEVAAAPNQDLISPSVVYRGPGDWQMWSVNAGVAGCASDTGTVERRTSVDGLHWSDPTPVMLAPPGPGRLSVWHLQVEWVPEFRRYWAIFNARPSGSCRTTVVFVAESADGVTWRTRGEPALSAGAIPAFSNVVYRSSLLYDPLRDAVHIWFSGATVTAQGDQRWSVATRAVRRAVLFPVRSSAGPEDVPAVALGAAARGPYGGDAPR